MMLIQLHPKVPAQRNRSNGNEKQEPVRKNARQSVKPIEKVKSESRKLELLGDVSAKQGSRISSLIRIQLEETKRRVRECSPAALQFIGPGDR